MAMPATQIRRGMVLVFEGDPCRVIEFRHHTPGNLRAMVQAKLKNLRSGNSFEHRFRAADTIERASTEPAKLENGVTVNVPEFVNNGEKIRVNPNTGEYMDRAK